MPDEIEAEPAPRVDDAAVGDELDEIGGLLLVDVVGRDELQANCGGDHSLLEVERRELEPVPQELDDEVVPRTVVRSEHRNQGI